MSLKEQILFISVNKLIISIGSVFFGLLGLFLYFYIPPTYKAVGTLYVSRAITTTTTTEFSYEGYYARQNAVSYVPSVVGMLESVSTRKFILEKLEYPVTVKNLQRLNSNISVKKPAPQLIEVSYKSQSPENAADVWKTLTSYVVSKHYDLNSDIDSTVSIKYLSEAPVVVESFRNPVLNFFVGLLIGFVLMVFVLAFKRYLHSAD